MKFLKILLDALIANLSVILCFYIRFSGFPEANFEAYKTIWIFFTFVPVMFFYFLGTYSRKKSYSMAEIFYDSFLSSILSGGLNTIFTFYGRAFALPRTLILLNIFIHGVLSFLAHSVYQYFILKYSPKQKLLVYGYSDKSFEIIKELLVTSPNEFEITYIPCEETKKEYPPKIKGNRKPLNKDSFISYLRNNSFDILILAFRSKDYEYVLDLCFNAWEMNVEVKIFPDVYEVFIGNKNIQQIGGMPVLDVVISPYNPWQAFIKRSFDIVVSAIGLLILFPLMVIIGIFIKIESRGPIFFKQKRLGKNSKEFTIIKFRTMINNAEAKVGPVLATQNDERITKIGKVLRKSRLDEVPQFLNVLIGNMSIIGPRPERAVFFQQFGKIYPLFYFRTIVKPGITGLAQVHGKYDISPENKLKYDLAYITGWTFLLDLKIVFWTLKVVFTGKGAV